MKTSIQKMSFIFLLMPFVCIVPSVCYAQTSIGFATTGTVTNTNPNPINVHNDIYIGKGANTNSGWQFNTAVGTGNLLLSTTGNVNSAFGYNSMAFNTTGAFNTSVGVNALRGASAGVPQTGSRNVAMGNSAMQNNSTGGDNVGVGASALVSTTTGSFNVALGAESMPSWSGSIVDNVAIGYRSLGALAGLSTSANVSNNAIGSRALSLLITGSDNNVHGTAALGNLNNGGQNIGVGSLALQNLTSGSQNIAIGHQSGASLTIGSNNISIGVLANHIYGSGASASNQLVIADCIYGLGINNGNTAFVGIGHFSSTAGDQPTQALDVKGRVRIRTADLNPTAVANYLYREAGTGVVREAPIPSQGITTTCTGSTKIGFVPKNSDAVGNLTCSKIYDNGTSVGIGTTGTFNYTVNTSNGDFSAGVVPSPGTATLRVLGVTWSGGFYATSDKKFKKDIRPIADALSKISKLDGKIYFWDKSESKSLNFDEAPHSGFIAQELENVLPHLVATDSDGEKAINYIELMPYLVQGIKEQQIQIELLKAEVTELKEKASQQQPGQSKFSINKIEVVPNPVTGVSIVSYKLENKNLPASLVIYNLQGKVLKQMALPKNSKEGQVEVSKSQLAAGMYIFSIVAGGTEIQSKKVLVSD